MVGKLSLELKTDSFAVESHVHFPTDFNLLWDSVRKCLDLLEQLKLSTSILGFRKLQFWRTKSYAAYRKAAEIHRNKGKNYQDRLTEATPSFAQARRKHSTVESNINELEQSGADKVRDKGMDGFKKYVGWSVLAHNLKRLGGLVIKREALPTVKCYKKAA